MTETDKLVKNHLILTKDGKCINEGHELIYRACVHCGLTLQQIAEENGGEIPMRDTASARAERLEQLREMLDKSRAQVADIERTIATLVGNDEG